MEGPVPDGDLPESLPVQQAAAWLGVSPQVIHKTHSTPLIRVGFHTGCGVWAVESHLLHDDMGCWFERYGFKTGDAHEMCG